MPCLSSFEITFVWCGYHILIFYVIQCAHAYINPGVYKTHEVFIFIKCPWKILGLWILSNTAFRIYIYSFENIIGSNINGCDALTMERYEGIIFLHIFTRFWLIKWNTICVDILNMYVVRHNIHPKDCHHHHPNPNPRHPNPHHPTPPPPPPPRERCIQIGICFHFREQVYLHSLKAQLLGKCLMM